MASIYTKKKMSKERGKEREKDEKEGRRGRIEERRGKGIGGGEKGLPLQLPE